MGFKEFLKTAWKDSAFSLCFLIAIFLSVFIGLGFAIYYGISIYDHNQDIKNGDYIIGYVDKIYRDSNPFTGEFELEITLLIDSNVDGQVFPFRNEYSVPASVFVSYQEGDIVYFDENNQPIWEVD